jgi:hypothetical protein
MLTQKDKEVQQLKETNSLKMDTLKHQLEQEKTSLLEQQEREFTVQL